MPKKLLTLFKACCAHHYDRIRVLFREYQQLVGEPICFKAFKHEVAGLPGDYAEPTGCLLIAEIEGRDVGCVAVRPLAGDPAAAELKRLYVRPDVRGVGIGRILVTGAIEFARQAGYRRIQLDTLETMEAARRLYESRGFQNILPSEGQPREHPILMELKL
jgi:putative acetyltransferase